MSDYYDDEWEDRCRHDNDEPPPKGRTWECEMCGGTHWPSNDTTCPLCYGDDEDED